MHHGLRDNTPGPAVGARSKRRQGASEKGAARTSPVTAHTVWWVHGDAPQSCHFRFSYMAQYFGAGGHNVT